MIVFPDGLKHRLDILFELSITVVLYSYGSEASAGIALHFPNPKIPIGNFTALIGLDQHLMRVKCLQQ